MLLLLLLNFVSGCKLELMYISLSINIRLSLTHLHGFQQLFYSMAQRSSEYDKANLFARMFSKNYNLLDLGISLPVFHSRTNLKLHNISITSKFVKKVITNLDSS